MTRKTADKGGVNAPKPQVIVHSYPRFLDWVIDGLGRAGDSRGLRALCFVLLPLAVLAYYPTSPGDYDIWFHLAYGRHYVENLTWSIDHGQFSWTPAISDWKYVTWIGSSILYLVYSLAGIVGLSILQLVVLGFSFGLLVTYLRKGGQSINLWWLWALLLVAVTWKLVSVYIKPEMFTTLFFTSLVFCYFYRRLVPRTHLIWGIPLLLAVWVNTHGGFIFGLFFLTLVLLLEGVNYLFRGVRSEGDGKALYSLALVVALSYAAALLNPYGIQYHLTIVEYLLNPEYMGEAGRLFAYQSMWQYLQLTLNNLFFVLAAWSLLFMFLSFSWLFYRSWSRTGIRDYVLLAINLVFFFLSMHAARMVIFYPPIWFLSCAVLASGLPGTAVRRTSIVNLAWGCGTILLSGFIFYTALSLSTAKNWLGAGFMNYLPVKEIEYIQKHQLPGPLFNDYVIGGYMLWAMREPQYKVWIDPRYGPYINSTLPDWFGIGTTYPMSKEGYEKFIEKYPIKTALIHFQYSNVIFWLMSAGDWRMAYFDKAAAVLIPSSSISQLSQEALDTDMSTARYVDVMDPQVLTSLFNFYINISRVHAEEILALYGRNVSSWYYFKKKHMTEMQEVIKRKYGE